VSQLAPIWTGASNRNTVLPHPYAFNLFSHNTKVDPVTGYNEERRRSSRRPARFSGLRDACLSNVCRVPVLRAHCVSLTFECERPINATYVREVLSGAPGVKIVDDVEKNYFPMPKDASGQDPILVGRIRQDLSDPSGHSIAMFVAGDQLLRSSGAPGRYGIGASVQNRGVWLVASSYSKR